MKAISSLFERSLGKMYWKPLYRFAMLLLGLPVHLIAYGVYKKRRSDTPYERSRAEALSEFKASGEETALREHVALQLKNKLSFMKRSLGDAKFDAEVERIFNERREEQLDIIIRRTHGRNAPEKVTYISTLCSLMHSPGFLLLSVIIGLPMMVLALIYAGAYSKYIFERVFMMVFVIFGVTALVFTILYFSPLDAATNILGPTATRDQIASFNRTYNLDQPFFTQLVTRFKGLATFELGKSYMGNEDVASALMRRFPITLQLTLYSLLLAVTIALPVGIISAVRPYTIADYTLMLFALLGLSIPTFWMGLVLIAEFAIHNPIFPATFQVDNWRSLVLPAIVLGTSLAASVTRMTRSSMLEVINQDYIVTAKAKGLSRGRVIVRHALANAMIPIVTIIGLNFGGMLGGSAVTEKVFNVNGIGKFIVDKQFVPDTPVVLAGVVYLAVVISFVNLFVDLLYTFLDPRIKSKLKNY